MVSNVVSIIKQLIILKMKFEILINLFLHKAMKIGCS
jgi:hypothetical protein